MSGAGKARAVSQPVWRRNYSMAALSSWRAGGRAAWLFVPEGVRGAGSSGAAAEARLPLAPPKMRAAGMGACPPLFAGYGSNLLVRDGGYDGIVVRTAPGLGGLRLRDDGAVEAQAGVGCPKLARFCAARGLDAAFFAGIPGTLGGALAMNAGCHGAQTWEFVEEVTLFEDGAAEAGLPHGMARRAPDAFEVGYRTARRRDGAAAYFAAAILRFAAAAPDIVQGRIRELLQARAASQPIGAASAGSVFCNPPNDHAGRLIESCGLKGEREGGAVVSEKHANFIVNDQGASAADIERLIERVRQRVADKTGVLLMPEVKIVGEAA